MIATIFRDRHTGRTHRSRGRQRTLALAAAAFVVVTALAASPIPASATPSPSPTPTEVQEATITAAVGTTGTLRPGEPLRVTVDFDNTTDTELPGGVATVAIGSTPLPNSDAMAQWLDDAADAAVADVSTATVPALAAGRRAATTLSVPATSSTLQALAPGVYPLRATLQAGGSTLSTRGVFTVEGPARNAPVALVVPVTAPPASRTLIDAKELGLLTAPDGALTAALDGADDPTVVLAVDPAVVASIRVLGNAAPPSAAEWLAKLEAMPNERFALQFADADVASQYDAGQTPLMQPESLASFMLPANFANVTPSPSASPEPDPQASASPAASQLPTLEQLTDVSATLDGVLWPATGTVTDPVLAQSGAATLLTASGQVAGQPSGRINADGRSVLVYDEPTSTALRTAATTVDPAGRAAAVSEMVAASTFSAASNAGAPGLVVLDRGATLNAEATRAAVAAFRGAGNTATSLAQLQAAPERPASLTAAAVSPDHVARVQTLLTEQSRVGAFSTVLVEPPLLTGRERARLLQTLAAGWAHQPRWAAAYDAQQAATTAVLESVRVVGGDDLMIVGSGVNLPVSVRNNLPFAVSADLIVQPVDLRLKVQRVTKIEAGPGSATRARVPVTGVSNGETTLRFSLVSPEGIAIGPTKSVRVTVRADWERIGLVVLAVLAAALFGFGTLRTIRRRRRGEVEARPSRKDARAAFRKPAGDGPANDTEQRDDG